MAVGVLGTLLNDAGISVWLTGDDRARPHPRLVLRGQTVNGSLSR